jgi:hypothetical protein
LHFTSKEIEKDRVEAVRIMAQRAAEPRWRQERGEAGPEEQLEDVPAQLGMDVFVRRAGDWKSLRHLFNGDTPAATIYELLFADDCVIMATSERALQRIVTIFDRVLTAFGQEISPKTKVMVTLPAHWAPRALPEPQIMLLNGNMQEVNRTFKYIGGWANTEGNMSTDVGVRIRGMCAAYAGVKERVLENGKMSLVQRYEVFNSIVVAVGLYGCASWNLAADELRRLEATHTKLLRRMVGADERSSLEDIIMLAAGRNCLIKPFEAKWRALQLRYLGHVERMPEDALQRIVLYGVVGHGESQKGGGAVSYRRCVKVSLRLFGIPWETWQVLARDRGARKRAIEEHGLEHFMAQWAEARAVSRAARYAGREAARLTAAGAIQAVYARVCGEGLCVWGGEAYA